MAYRYNPLSGRFDYTDNNPQDAGTTKPENGTDGSVFTVEISGDGRIYFWANGNRYYVSGILDAPAANRILTEAGDFITTEAGDYLITET